MLAIVVRFTLTWSSRKFLRSDLVGRIASHSSSETWEAISNSCWTALSRAWKKEERISLEWHSKPPWYLNVL